MTRVIALLLMMGFGVACRPPPCPNNHPVHVPFVDGYSGFADCGRVQSEDAGAGGLEDCSYVERRGDTVVQRLVRDGRVYETTYRVTAIIEDPDRGW